MNHICANCGEAIEPGMLERVCSKCGNHYHFSCSFDFHDSDSPLICDSCLDGEEDIEDDSWGEDYWFETRNIPGY